MKKKSKDLSKIKKVPEPEQGTLNYYTSALNLYTFNPFSTQNADSICRRFCSNTGLLHQDPKLS